MSEKPLIKESLSVIGVCGLNPAKKSIIWRCITLAMVLHLAVEVFLQCLLNWKGWRSAQNIMVFSAAFQAFFKGASIATNTKQLLSLFIKIERFTPTKDLDPEFRGKIENLPLASGRLQRIFFSVAFFTLVVFLSGPALTPDRSLPFESYHPGNVDQNFVYFPVYLLQMLEGFFALIADMGFDILFFALILQITFELKIIKRQISRMACAENEEERLKEIGAVVDHHNLVLRCIKNLDGIFSVFLLSQFGFSTTFICISLLGVVSSGFPPKLGDLAPYLSFLTIALAQLFIYCIAGTYLITESESVSDAVYESDWWKQTRPKFRRACVMVIQRANKTEYLTAGGMITLNLENFTRVVKLGLSVFSVAQAVNNKY